MQKFKLWLTSITNSMSLNPLSRQKRAHSFSPNVPFSVGDEYTRLKLNLQKPARDLYTR